VLEDDDLAGVAFVALEGHGARILEQSGSDPDFSGIPVR
jgi:hypothetical protein